MIEISFLLQFRSFDVCLFSPCASHNFQFRGLYDVWGIDNDMVMEIFPTLTTHILGSAIYANGLFNLKKVFIPLCFINEQQFLPINKGVYRLWEKQPWWWHRRIRSWNTQCEWSSLPAFRNPFCTAHLIKNLNRNLKIFKSQGGGQLPLLHPNVFRLDGISGPILLSLKKCPLRVY